MRSGMTSVRAEVRAWLEANGVLRQVSATPASEEDADIEWGVGSDNVAVFHNRSHAEEAEMLAQAKTWQAKIGKIPVSVA